MAHHQECTDQSSLTMISTSSSTPPPPPSFWWDNATSLTSWMTAAATTGSWHDHQSNPSSNSSCEEDIDASRSFSSASNYLTGLTVESLSRRLVDREPSNSHEFLSENASDSQIWSHILFGVGSNVGELHSGTHQDAEENFLDAFSSKSAVNNGSSDRNDHDDHYSSKKMGHNYWDQFTTLPISCTTTNNNTFDSGRLTKLSSPMVSHLSIAPPDYQEVVMNCQTTSDHGRDHHHHHLQLACDISLTSPDLNDHYRSTTDDHHLTSLTTSLSCYNGRGGRGGGDHLKVDQKNDIQARDIDVNHHHSSTSTPGAALFRRSNNFNSLSAPMAESDNNSKINGYISGGLRTRLIKLQEDINHQGSKDSKPSLNLSETTTKQRLHHSSSRKRSGDTTSEALTKKAKNETSRSSPLASVKIQAPKVKLSEKITTLQQIVSPFGRTDTASVLHEAIQYVKFLQEQVQDFWCGFDRKDKGDIINHDLWSKGLCLVPISCTPQAYHENTGSDYWTPTYRGCSYR